MKKLFRQWSMLLVVALIMQLVAIPALAVDENTEKRNDMTVNDGSAERETIVTEMYTANVPANAVIVYEGESTQASQALETTTFSNESAIVAFDYETTLDEMYTHVLQNNTDLSTTQAMEIAKELTNRIKAANELATKEGSSNKMMGNSTNVVDLGCILDGELVYAPSSKQYIPDSRTSIISEGWSVNPHVAKSTLWSRYVIEWNGLDLYKSSDSGSMTFNKDVSTSINIGFEGNADFTKADALKFGLKVTASGSVTSTISKGYTLNVAAWTKHMVRPYIYYYVDEYEGTYRYYCYNSYEKRYFYVTEKRTAQNQYNTEKGIRSWTRVNTAHNPNARSPEPPKDWEW